jgi:hypothetical protein
MRRDFILKKFEILLSHRYRVVDKSRGRTTKTDHL